MYHVEMFKFNKYLRKYGVSGSIGHGRRVANVINIALSFFILASN